MHTVGNHPGIDAAVEGIRAVDGDVLQHDQRQDKRDRHAQDGDRVRTRAPDLPSEQPGDEGAYQRRKRYGEVEFLHG